MSAANFEVSMTFDDEDFMKNFNAIVEKKIPDLVLKGLFQAGGLLLSDAINDLPRAPHKTGTLWREKKVDIPKKEGDTFFVVAGFNVKYAAYVHEGLASWTWTLSGSGPKFLESKLAANMKRYVQRIADVVSGGGEGKE